MHAGEAVEPSGHFHELLIALAGDADDDGRAQRGQIGQMTLDKDLDAVIVQPNRIEHAAGGFDGSRRWVADPWALGDGLGQDSTQPSQIHQTGHFSGVTESTRCNQDRIAEPQPS